MLYYLGKGTEFKKEDCKEYKTIEGALKAAAKNEELVVWDENGNVIGSLTNNVPEGALETNPDGSVNTYNANGNKVGTMTAEELKAATTLTDEKDAEAAAKMSFSSFRFVSVMFTTRNVRRNIRSLRLCKSCNRFFASFPKVARSDGIISIS